LNNTEIDSLLNTLGGTDKNLGVAPAPIPQFTCHYCQKPVMGEIIQAMGKHFHPEHFLCQGCTKPLGTGNFFPLDADQGFASCETCFFQYYCPRCPYCNECVTDKCIQACNKKWHVNHFMCWGCGIGFPNGNFFEKEEYPYCETCFIERFAPRCASCGEIITGDCLNALDLQWHPNHFVCTHCQQPFPGGAFFAVNGMPYCSLHIPS